jgi:hypothetical protein
MAAPVRRLLKNEPIPKSGVDGERVVRATGAPLSSAGDLGQVQENMGSWIEPNEIKTDIFCPGFYARRRPAGEISRSLTRL